MEMGHRYNHGVVVAVVVVAAVVVVVVVVVVDDDDIDMLWVTWRPERCWGND
jgi:hypothetical protein